MDWFLEDFWQYPSLRDNIGYCGDATIQGLVYFTKKSKEKIDYDGQ